MFCFYRIPQTLFSLAANLYSTHLYNYFKKIYLRNVSYFITNLYKSEIYWFFQTLIHHFEIDVAPTFHLTPPVTSLSTQYYTPITTSNISFHNKRYVSAVMYFLMYTLTAYHSLVQNHQMHFNFLLITPEFKFFKYVNRYLFKVFNF